MPEGTLGLFPDASETRVLDGRAVVLHYKHIKAGIGSDPNGCSFCKHGVNGVVTESSRKVAEPVVREGAGADEEKTAPLPLDGGWYFDGDGLLREKS